MDEELKQNLIYATLQTSSNSPFNINAGDPQRVFQKIFEKTPNKNTAKHEKNCQKEPENKQHLRHLPQKTIYKQHNNSTHHIESQIVKN